MGTGDAVVSLFNDFICAGLPVIMHLAVTVVSNWSRHPRVKYDDEVVNVLWKDRQILIAFVCIHINI